MVVTCRLPDVFDGRRIVKRGRMFRSECFCRSANALCAFAPASRLRNRGVLDTHCFKQAHGKVAE